MKIRLCIVALAAVTGSVASAATFNVSDPAEFQNALTTAQNNGEPDTINVAAGFYNIASTLTYTASASENAGLLIQGADSTTVTLDGGSQVPILRIDTTQVINDGGVSIEVYNMTFQNGAASGTPADGGALAILTDESQQPAEFATIVWIGGSEFYGNTATGDGGAVYVRAHAVEGIYLDDLTFDRFQVDATTFVSNEAGGDGGNAYVAGGLFTTPIAFQNIDFFYGIAAGSGGGLTVEGFDAATPSAFRASSVSLFDISFNNNVSNSVTGGGGGADVASISIFIDTVGFVDNEAWEGGGLRVRPSWSDLTMINTGFTGNRAAATGGGMAVRESFFTTFIVTNNTFFANTANGNGGGLHVLIDGSASFAQIYNNIIYGNTSEQGTGDDLFVNNRFYDDMGVTTELFNNDITDFDIGPIAVVEGSNIDAPPSFVGIDDRPQPNPRLQGGSPAIDAGDNSAPGAPTRDFEFDARPFDGDAVAGAVIDIGMDEYTGAPVQNADLAVSKTDSPDPVTGGNDLTYTAVVTNNGPGDASSVVLTDTLDGAVTFTSATPTQGSCTESSGIVTCPIGQIANGASETVTIVVATPVVDANTPIDNVASVTAAENDPNTSDNTATESTVIIPAGPATADLALTKSDSPDPVFSGGPQLTYTLTVTNNGPDTASNVVLTDTLPAGVTFESSTPGTDTCSESAGVVTCNLGDLVLDDSATVTIVVTPAVVAEPTVITNNATVTANEVDPTPANNDVSEITTVNAPVSDMMVTVVATPTNPSVGETVTYDITVMNGGPSDNLGINMIVTLPDAGDCPRGSGFDLDVTVSQGSWQFIKSGELSFDIGDMLAGATVTAQVVCTAPDEAVSLVMSASVSGSVGDPVGTNNTDSASVTVIDTVDIVIQGKSEGTGAVGWLELLFVTAAVMALRSLRTARHAVPCLIAAVAALMLVPAGSAVAQGDFYVQGAFGQTDLDYSASDLTSDLSSFGWTIRDPVVDSDEAAWKIMGGFTINQHAAVEIGYVNLGEVMTQFGATVAPTEIDDILSDTYSIHPYQGDGWVLAGVVTWPVDPDKFSVNIKLGAFNWESKTDVRVIQGGSGSVSGEDRGTDGMYSFGIEWKLNPSFALTAEWERYKMNEWLDVPFIGVKVSF